MKAYKFSQALYTKLPQLLVWWQDRCISLTLHIQVQMAKCLWFLLVTFETDLECALSVKLVAVECLDRAQGLVVIQHVYESVALAPLVGLVPDDFHVGHGSVGSKQLPQESILAVGREVVDKDAPALAIVGHSLQIHVGDHVRAGQRIEPADTKLWNLLILLKIQIDSVNTLDYWLRIFHLSCRYNNVKSFSKIPIWFRHSQVLLTQSFSFFQQIWKLTLISNNKILCQRHSVTYPECLIFPVT